MKIKMPCTKAYFKDRVALLLLGFACFVLIIGAITILDTLLVKAASEFKGIKPIVAQVWCGKEECKE